MPLPTIEETGGGVMAIIQRETMDEVIAKRGANVGDKTYCSSASYRRYYPLKPFCFCETNVGDFVGDIKDN